MERRAGCHERYQRQVVNPRHDRSRETAEQAARRGKIDGLKLAGVISTIHPTLDYAGFDRVDVVVEAVVENPKVKKAVLAETEQKVRPDTVLASNTSTIPISELANALERPEKLLRDALL